jgi:hypothetical protein
MLGVSGSGYYKHLKTKANPKKADELVWAMIKILEEDEETENYGKNRVRERLREFGHKSSPSRVSRMMDENGLKAVSHCLEIKFTINNAQTR